MDEKPLVIRIAFLSGAVSEERGVEDDIEALFAADYENPEHLLDYVLALDPKGGEILFAHHEGDHRYDDYEP